MSRISLASPQANPYTDIRLAVISATRLIALNRLRAFRHRERNSCGLRLEPDIVLDRAQEIDASLSQFHSEVLAMFVALKPTDGPIAPP